MSCLPTSLQPALARFRRRSIVVSKAKRLVEATMALVARFCVNGSIDDLASISA